MHPRLCIQILRPFSPQNDTNGGKCRGATEGLEIAPLKIPIGKPPEPSEGLPTVIFHVSEVSDGVKIMIFFVSKPSVGVNTVLGRASEVSGGFPIGMSGVSEPSEA